MPLLSDLAALFAPYESGTKVPATNIKIAGTDLSDLFAPASMGAATVPTTGILANGADIATLFAAVGTTTKLSDSFKGFYSDNSIGSGTQTASVQLYFYTDGTYNGAGRSGRWLAAGLNAALYEIKITVNSGAALDSNTAATFTALTSTKGCTLSVTAPTGYANKQTVTTIEIREIATPTNQVSATVTIDVSVESWGSSTYPP